MSKQFVEGNVYVFTKKKITDRHKISQYSTWVNDVNGNQVKVISKYMGLINGYAISPEWCKYIKNNN